MQPFETIAIILLFPTLAGLFISSSKRPQWLPSLPAVSLALTVLLVLLGSHRWQMVPVMVAAVVLCLVAVVCRLRDPREHESPRPRARRILKALGVVFAFALLSIASLIPILLPVFTLPEPTGPYSVGTQIFRFIDKSRLDTRFADPEDHRQISIQAWYPSERVATAKTIPYLTRDAAVCWANSWGIQPSFLLTHFPLVKTNSYLNVEPMMSAGPFPVVLFSPSGSISINTSLFEELASHGYVVLSIGHPHWFPYLLDETAQAVCSESEDPYYEMLWREESLDAANEVKEALTIARWPEEKMALQKELNAIMPLEVEDVRWWAEDYDSAIREIEEMNRGSGLLAGVFDLDRVGVMGFSKGGAAAGLFCASDLRCRAGGNLGGFMLGEIVERRITQPFLFMEHVEAWCEECLPVNEHVFMNSESTAYMVRIRNAKHYNFTDLSLAGPFMQLVGLNGSIDGREFVKIQNEYVLAFFNKHLRNVDTPLLGDSALDNGQVMYKSRLNRDL